MKCLKGEPKGATGLLLEMFLGLCSKYGKWYCWIYQDSMLLLLKKYDDMEIAKSTLNYWLAYLADDGWINKYRHYWRDNEGRIHSGPTRFYLTAKAIKWLKRIKKCVQKVFRVTEFQLIGMKLSLEETKNSFRRYLPVEILWKKAIGERLKPSKGIGASP